MTGITQKICYRMRKEISEKINRMPMKYFESRTYGEVLSRITNDVDTLGTGIKPECDADHYVSCNTDRCACDDAQHFTVNDTDCTCDLTGLHGILISFVVKKFAEIFPRRSRNILGHINGQVEEVYGGHLVIKAFNKEKDMIEEFDETNEMSVCIPHGNLSFCPV